MHYQKISKEYAAFVLPILAAKTATAHSDAIMGAEAAIPNFWARLNYVESDFLALLDSLSNAIGTFKTIPRERITPDQQCEIAELELTLRGVWAWLCRQWHQSLPETQVIEQKYIPILLDHAKQLQLRIIAFDEIRKHVRSHANTDPGSITQITSHFRAELADLKNPAELRVRLLEFLVSIGSPAQKRDLIVGAMRSSEASIRASGMHCARWLPTDLILLEDLKKGYVREHIEHPAVAINALATLKIIAGGDVPRAKEILEELREFETDPGLIKKIDWYLWALKSEEEHREG